MPDDPEGQVGQLHSFGGIAEGSLPALLEEELAESPGMELLVRIDLPDLLGIGPLRETGPELARLLPLDYRDLRVPMTDLLLDPQDLLVPFAANGTLLQEVRHDEAQD